MAFACSCSDPKLREGSDLRVDGAGADLFAGDVVIAHDFLFWPALGGQSEDEFHRQTRAANDRLAHQHCRIGDNVVMRIHGVNSSWP